MTTIYHLSSCDTCKRILKTWAPDEGVKLVDIKATPLSEEEIDTLRAHSGSYEALVNKRARLYKERGLGKKDLSESDYRTLLLEHYTFLKRPVVLVDDEAFIGNSKNVVAAAAEALKNE